MSRVWYLRALPRDPATAATVATSLAGGGSKAPYRLGGVQYRAGVVQEPRFSCQLGFDAQGWTGGALPTSSGISFAPADPALLVQLANLYWPGASLEIDAGEESGALDRRLTGTVAEASVSDGQLVLTIADFSAKLDMPAVQSYFAGTGGAEGAAVAQGRVKRRSYGRVFNVEGRVLDPATNVYEFGDPGRPLQSCVEIRDRGRAGPLTILSWAGSIATTLAALKASVPAEGGAVFAPSIACAKWWTQAAGPLAADLLGEVGSGYVETVPQIAAKVLLAAGGPALSDLSGATALRPEAAGLHLGTDSETTAAALDRLFLPVSVVWRLNTAGTIDILPWTWTGSAEAVKAVFIGREKTLPPHSTRRVGYRRNERIMTDSEIAADLLASDVIFSDGTSVDEAFAAIPLGGNQIINSEMELIEPAYSSTIPIGFEYPWRGDSTNIGSMTFADGRITLADGSYAMSLLQTGGTLSGGASYSGQGAIDLLENHRDGTLPIFRKYGLKVEPGERLAARVLCATEHVGTSFIEIAYWGEDGSYTVETPGPAQSCNAVGSLPFTSITRQNMVELTLIDTVPADGVGINTQKSRWATIQVRSILNGSANIRGCCAAPLLAKIAPGQTSMPLYAPGPGRRDATYGADWLNNLNGRPKLYHAISKGLSAAYGGNPGLFNETGALAISPSVVGRAYTVTIFNRSDGSLASSTLYDVSGSTANATAMASALNALGSDKIVVITTYDEPQGNRMFGTLPAAMYRCGASPAVYGSANIFKYRSAYILIGIPGMGTGAGYEAYQGEADNSAGAWLDVPFMIYQGNPIVSATAYTNSSVKDLDFVGELDADKTINHTSNDTANVGGTPAAAVLGNIATAASNAQSALDELDDLADDAILSINEKITKLIPQAAALEASYTSLATLAGALGVSASTATSTRSSWLSVLSGISPAWNGTGADSPVVRSTFNAALTNYQGALSALASDCAAMAATKASWSGVSGAGKAEDNATRNVGRGDYAAGTAYNPGDVVKWPVSGGGDGGGHIRIGTGATTGVAPSDTSKWAVFVEKGDTGGQGVPGPALFTLVNHSGTTLTTDSVTKTGGTNGAWDASAYSAEGYVGGAFAGATVTAASTATMFGLNQDPTTNASYDTLDFAFYVNGSNVLEIWESNTFIASYGGVSPGDVLSISYDDKQTVYYKNGTALRTIAATSGLRLCYDTSLLFTGGKVSGVKFGPAGKAGDTGAAGTPSITLSPLVTIDVPCSSTGVPKAALPGFQIVAHIGAVDVAPASSGSTYSFTSSGLSGVTDNGNGSFGVTGFLTGYASGYVEVTITNSGIPAVGRQPYRKALDPPTGTYGEDLTITVNNSGSFGPTNGGPLTEAAGPNGTVALSAHVPYSFVSGSGRVRLAGLFQYRTTPGVGSWIDIGVFTQDSIGTVIGDPAVLDMFETLAGPASTQNYEYQLLLKRGTGTATIQIDTGAYFTVTWGP